MNSIGAYALIDRSAIQHNLVIIRKYAPQAKIMAVVKANAYGHDISLVAQLLKGIDAVAVARIDEGVQLRLSGFKAQILILEGFVYRDELALLLKYNLESVVHSVEQLALLESYKTDKPFSIWMKIDTGMNRLGFKPNIVKLAYQRLINCPSVKKPVAFLTHFSSADNIKSAVTSQQITLFKQLVGSYIGEKSMANSAAIIAWKEAITDWVRPGIMLYGISPFSCHSESFNLKPVMSLYSTVISIKTINKGESVGYGREWVCQRNTRLGIISIGYGDGYPRSVISGAPVLINNQRVPLVGRVSMDMITVDLTEHSNIKQGDLAVLWGKGLPVEEIAHYADTIPYTLLTGITARVKKQLVG